MACSRIISGSECRKYRRAFGPINCGSGKQPRYQLRIRLVGMVCEGFGLDWQMSPSL
jgi:hypothetical protein